MKKVSRKELLVLAVILIGFSVFVIPRVVFHPKGKGKIQEQKKGAQTYYCPMHPTYLSDRPGDCPICNMKLVAKPDAGTKKERKIIYYRHPMGQPDTSPVPKKDAMGMDYIPVYEDETVGKASEVPGHAEVQLSWEKQQLMGVKLGGVEKRKLVKEIRTSGRVVYDPDLFVAQQEYLSAKESLQKMAGGPYPEVIERAEALVGSSKMRLRLLGMSEEEVAELEKRATRDQNLILPGPGTISKSAGSQEHPLEPDTFGNGTFVWVYAPVYEYEIPFVKIGTPVTVRIPTFADRQFTGDVRALDPVLDPATRSIRMRARVSNPEGLLKPEMYVDVYLKTDLDEKVVVPVEAVMHTGERDLVFVAQGDGHFEPREVKLGAKTNEFYEIKSGLAAGERIAVSGNFLIDSESRLQGALAGMGGGEHQHG